MGQIDSWFIGSRCVDRHAWGYINLSIDDHSISHMHLLGQGMQITLNPGTPTQRTILNVPNYNFDYQKAYNVAPIPVSRGDRIQINCTYNPKLAQELPILRKAPPHFVTFGDGSSDEMCVGVTWQTSSVPNSHDSL